MSDYILLDFHTKRPRKERSGIDITFLAKSCANFFLEIRNLFHVVFQNNYREFVVYTSNNTEEPIAGPITLLENH